MEAISVGAEKAEIDQDECVRVQCLPEGGGLSDGFAHPARAFSARSVRGECFRTLRPQHGLTGHTRQGTEEIDKQMMSRAGLMLGEAGFVLDIPADRG